MRVGDSSPASRIRKTVSRMTSCSISLTCSTITRHRKAGVSSMRRMRRGRSARRYTGRSRRPPEAMLTPGQIVAGSKSRHGSPPFRGGHHRRVANRNKKLALSAHGHAEPVRQDEEAEPIRPLGPCSTRAARACGREEHYVELAALEAVHGSDADPRQPTVGVEPRNRRVEAEGIVTVPESESRPGTVTIPSADRKSTRLNS